MHCLQSLKKLNVIIALIIVTYCQALQQEIGEECTNEIGVVGVCQLTNNCSKDGDLGVTCNSEQSIICCAKNALKDKQQFNSSNEQAIQSRFSFIPDFFHVPVSPPKSISNINFFSHQKQKIPHLVGDILHHNLNTMQFVEDRPYQNFEQDVVAKPNKQKYTSTRPTNDYEYGNNNNNNQNLNTGNIFNSDQTTRKPQSYNNYPNYEISRPQNTNNYYSNYQSTQNNVPYLNTQRPSLYQNNINRPNHEKYQSNQNNNFNGNPNYYTKGPNSQNNYDSINYDYNSQQPFTQTSSNSNKENKRNQSNNYRPTSSNILFPDNTFNTKFTTTTKSYGYENRPNKNEKRISEIKCEEYSKILTTTVSALPLEIDTAPRPVSVEVCDSKSVELIVGGSKAELGEFPHMVAIGFYAKFGNPWNCGGTLISERFVLTAAHCTNTTLGNPVKVRLGELNLQKKNDGANPVDILVDEIIKHPDYVPTSKYNDIALIRLKSKVKFNSHIRPACLYNLDNIHSRKVTATGWGSIEYGSISSDDLLKVNLNVIDNRRCNKLYEAESKTITLNRGIANSMICAGDLAGGHDTCLGDSGGPLVIRSEKNACIFNLVGITSFGKFCAAENSPGVYTKVSTFLPWIEQIVWP